MVGMLVMLEPSVLVLSEPTAELSHSQDPRGGDVISIQSPGQLCFASAY